MPISVQCANCKNTYNLADALAGKKVKCRNCGSAISVPAPGVLGIEDDSLPPIPSLSGGLESDGATPSGRTCPSCGAISNSSANMCLVCGYSYKQAAPKAAAAPSAAKGPMLPIGLAEELATPKKRSRFQRAPGNPTLNNLDHLIRTVTFFLVIAGMVVWGIHVCMQRGNFNLAYLVPMLVSLAVLLLAFATPMSLAIKVTCNAIQYPPRHDNWLRCATPLVIPFAVSLLCSSGPADNASLAALYGFSWVIAIGLIIYFFRAAPVEWIASLIAGGATLFIVSLILGFITPTFSNSLYAELMPMGPWMKLATGHEPPPVTTKPAEPTAVVTTGPATAPGPVVVTPTPVVPTPAPMPAPNEHGVVVLTTPTHLTPPSPLQTPNPDVYHPPVVEATPGVDVTSDPGLQNIRDLSISMLPSPYMLVVKSGDNMSTVQRWSIAPLGMKGEIQNDELPGKPNQYLLNPAGSVLVTLMQFPKNQMILSSFDNKSLKKVPLDRKEWIGSPVFVGFVDPTHFMIRWKGGSEMLQIWSTDGVMSSTKNSSYVNDDPNYWAIYSNPLKGGARMAVVARGQQGIYEEIDVFHTEGWQVFKQITPMQMQYTCTGLALSPDGKAVAMSAQTTEGGTIMGFDLLTGDNLFTSIVPASTFPAHVARRFNVGINSTFLHGLVWMPNNQALVVGGNLVYDVSTGKRVGSLGVENAVDCYSVGTNTLAIVQDNAGTKNIVIVKVDLAAMKAEKP